MIIGALVILVAICFKLPKVGNKPLVLVKPKEPTGCKLVGTVKGTRLWAGDCVASEGRETRDGNGTLARASATQRETVELGLKAKGK
jgi:hypothetical protein